MYKYTYTSLSEIKTIIKKRIKKYCSKYILMNIFHDIIINCRPFKHYTKYPNMMVECRSPSKYTF